MSAREPAAHGLDRDSESRRNPARRLVLEVAEDHGGPERLLQSENGLDQPASHLDPLHRLVGRRERLVARSCALATRPARLATPYVQAQVADDAREPAERRRCAARPPGRRDEPGILGDVIRDVRIGDEAPRQRAQLRVLREQVLDGIGIGSHEVLQRASILPFPPLANPVFSGRFLSLAFHSADE